MRNLKFFFALLFLTSVAEVLTAGNNEFGGNAGFIQNNGQVVDVKGNTHPEVLCTYDEPNARLFFTKDKIVYLFYQYETEETEASREKMRNGDIEGARMLSLRIREQRIDFEFVNASPNVGVVYSEPTDYKVNYYKAHCPNGIRDITPFRQIKMENLFPNVDVVFKAMPGGIKYDLILKPGAKLSDVRFRYNGSENVSIKDGELLIQNKLLSFSESIPSSFYESDQRPAQVRYQLYTDNTFGFVTDNGSDVVSETLVIDPYLQWSTYFEPTTTSASSIRSNTTVDANGNFFYQVNTYAANMPLANPGGVVYYDPSYNPSSGLDMYFAKFNVNRTLVWATYLGGTGNQSNYYDHGMATYNGYLYIVGNTNSTNFPLKNQGGSAYYKTYPGSTCGFLSKFDISSGEMIHSTYLKSYDYHSIAVSNTGLIAIGSFNYTSSVTPDVLSRSGAYNQAAHGGDSDVFLYMFNNSLVQTWGTYFGGAGYCDMMGIAFDSNQNLFLFTRGGSQTSIPLVNPGGVYYDGTFSDKYDLAISKFNTSGALVWSTYYGGLGLEGLSYSNIRINEANDVICTSTTFSNDIYTYNQGGSAYFRGTAAHLTNGWGGDPCQGFYLRFSNSGVLRHATYVGYGTETSNYIHDQAQGSSSRQYLLLQSMAFPQTTISGHYSQANNTPASYNYLAIEFESDFSIRWASYLQGQNSYFERLGIDNTNGRLYATGTTSYASCNVLDPGAGAYYDGSKTQSNAHNIMQFDISICVPSTAPTSASASTNPICAGNSTNLSVSGGSLGTGASWHWYSGSCGGTAVGTGSSISVSPGTTTTYYVRAEGTCGTTACVSVTVTVNPLPVAPTSVSASPNPICAGQSTTLSYTGGSGTTFRWMTGSCGGTSVGTGNNLVVSPATTTTYYGRWENGCGNSTCQSVTVTVNPLPVAPTSVTATSNTICAGQSTTLSYSGGSGTTFTWHSGSCGGTTVGTGNNLSVSPASTTTYYGEWTNGCGTSTCQSVTITVNPLPVAPTSVSASPNPICAGQSTTLSYSGGSGTTFRWMTGSCGGTSVGTGNNLVVSPATTTTYYGRWENGCGNSTCQSVTVTVNPLPVAPTSVTATSTTICAGQSTTLSYSGGSGTTFTWHSGSCGGTTVGTGNNLSVSPASTTTYYGEWTNGCGTSTCQSVTITVNPLPVAPTSAGATATTICNGQSTTLSYSGGSGTTFNWYTGSCGGTLAGTGNNLSVSPTSTTTYYGAWSNGCGTSTCQSVTITVNPLPVAPTSVSATSTTICSGQSTSLTYSGGSGTTFNWYTGSCGGTLIGTGNNLSVSPSANTTYYGAWSNSCGTSTCQSVTITVNPLPVAPTSVSASPNPICAGQSTTLSYTGGSGTTFRWMTGSCGGTSVGTGNNLVVSPATTTTYYGRWENGCGNSSCQSVTVTVNTESTAPTSVSSNNNNICSGTTVTLTLSGGSLGTGASWYWYSGSCGGTPIGSGTTTLNVTPSATTTYYVRAEGTCNTTACASVTVTVNTGSTAATSVTATQTTICSGTSVDLTLVGGSLGTGASWQWYSGSCGGTSAGTGTSITVSPTVTTTYYVRAEETCGNTTCASVTIIVNDPSVAPTSINASATAVCSGAPVTLTVTGGSLGAGASWQWYTGSCGGTSAGSGASITVNPTVNTSYFVRAEGTCNTTTCVQADITIKDPSIEATSVTATPATICESGSTTLSVNGGFLGTGASWHWYSGSCGGASAGTGSSISVSPAVTTTYYVRAEGDCNTTICTSVQVTVIPMPDPGLDGALTICSSDAPVNLFSSLGGTPDAGGIWVDPAQVQVTQPIDPSTALAGTYLYIISGTDPCGPDTAEIALTILDAPKLDSIIITSNTMCNPPYNGEAEFQVTGGGGSYDFVLDGGAAQSSPVFTGLQAGSHTYNITGTTGCTITGTFIMTSNTGFVIDSVITSNILCNGDNNGTISIYAQGAVSFSIDNGATSAGSGIFTGLNAGNYSIIVVNAGNCQAVDNVTIAQPLALSTDTLVNPAVCGPTGSAQVACYGGTPPYTYAWDGGSSSQILTGQVPGTYTVTVTDQNGCTITTSAVIGSLPGTGTASVTGFGHISCYGANDGFVQVAMNFGIGPYTYTWQHNPGLDTAVADGLASGSYYVTIEDAYGCVATTNFTINEPSALSATHNITDATCGPTGAISVTASGGTSPYTYSWNNGGNTFSISGLGSGYYSLTVTDNHNCTLILDSLEVEDLGGSGTAQVTNLENISCQGMSDGSITVSMPAGAPPITYDWSHNPSLNAATATNLGPGNYFVTITDSYGCTAIVNATITEPAVLTGNYLPSSVICHGTATGSVNLTVSGGTAPYFFSWDNLVTTEDLSGVPAGYYAVTVTDNNGCTWTASNILVRDVSEILASYNITDVACNGENSGAISVSLIGGSSPFVYQWSNGGNSSVNSNLAAGEYSVTITDANGCVISDTMSIVQSPAMFGSLALVHPQCYNSPTGEISVTVNGGQAPYSFEWSHATSLNDSLANNLLFGTYTVTIVDANGCEYPLSAELLNSETICLVIPDLFTPNDDGVNETFEILGIDAFPDAIMQIYNRWGDLIFKSSRNNDFWDGTWNGEPMPMGPYVFILDLRNGDEPIQGVVTIVY